MGRGRKRNPSQIYEQWFGAVWEPVFGGFSMAWPLCMGLVGGWVDSQRVGTGWRGRWNEAACDCMYRGIGECYILYQPGPRLQMRPPWQGLTLAMGCTLAIWYTPRYVISNCQWNEGCGASLGSRVVPCEHERGSVAQCGSICGSSHTMPGKHR